MQTASRGNRQPQQAPRRLHDLQHLVVGRRQKDPAIGRGSAGAARHAEKIKGAPAEADAHFRYEPKLILICRAFPAELCSTPGTARAEKKPRREEAAGLSHFLGVLPIKSLLASLPAYAEVLRIVVEDVDSLSQFGEADQGHCLSWPLAACNAAVSKRPGRSAAATRYSRTSIVSVGHRDLSEDRFVMASAGRGPRASRPARRAKRPLGSKRGADRSPTH